MTAAKTDHRIHLIMFHRYACIAGAALFVLNLTAKPVLGDEIHLQMNFPPLLLTDAPEGGAHPLGGLALNFVRKANTTLEHVGTEIIYHVSGEVPASDVGMVEGPIVDLVDRGWTIYDAVAAAAAADGIDMGIGISNQNGLSFGELHVAGLPFGLEADEFAAYLYGGGGLELQQELYDQHFDSRLIVMPIAITSTQGGGWFPEPLPNTDHDPGMDDEAAMAALCRKPWIVRWPEPGAGIWQTACDNVGVPAIALGAEARCADPHSPCSLEDNPLVNDVDHLAFGGFVPGAPPHVFLMNGNIDAYELNLPFTDVMLIKAVLGQAGLSNQAADLSPAIDAAPYYYGQTWHQPYTYLELLINRAFWQRLTAAERQIIKTAAESATLTNWAKSLSHQGKGIKLLRQHGATLLRWPDGLLRLLREASDRFLDAKAETLAAAGDRDYGRVLDHMRRYAESQAVYADFGDLNQGRTSIPSSPKP